ncbi:tripartite motif-containing protein 14 [Pelomyxa schiedti]|nr:tripartite motif-containing protein 14 [Pelomyxa schiedti]
MEALSHTSSAPSDIKCKRAKCNSSAVMFCSLCQNSPMCTTCVNLHNELLESHISSLVPIDNLSRSTIKQERETVPECPLHSGNTQQLFCLECGVGICHICPILQHKGHTVSLLSAEMNKRRESLSASMVIVKKRRDLAQGLLDDTSKKLTAYDQDLLAAKAEIRSKYTSLVNALNAQCEETISTLDKDFMENMAVSKEKLSRIQRHCEQLDSMLFYVSSLQTAPDRELINVVGKVTKQLKRLMKESLQQPEVISFSPCNNEAFSRALKFIQEIPRVSVVTREKPGPADLPVLNVAQLDSRNTSGPSGPAAQVYEVGLGGTATIDTDGYQHWTVPETARYCIVAKGASSVAQTYSSGPAVSETKGRKGRGAIVSGTFALNKNDTLLILVGQQPNQSEFNGGGGGTFVTLGPNRRTSIPLVVAGGGGSYRVGYHSDFDWQAILDANTEPNGNSNQIFKAGIDGFGGSCFKESNRGGGGAGFLGNGEIPDIFGYAAAMSFRTGGKGGDFKTINGSQNGGFGGGGPGGYGGSGGGGGYSGGSAGDNNYNPPGGGGGSYIDTDRALSSVSQSQSQTQTQQQLVHTQEQQPAPITPATAKTSTTEVTPLSTKTTTTTTTRIVTGWDGPGLVTITQLEE